MRLRRPILVLAALVLANCGTSPKTHYFTLAAVPAEQENASISSPVTVAAVHVPPSLDRREMVRRTGENTVDISNQDRWTAPLGDMIRGVLSHDLEMRLPQDKVVPPDAPPPPKTAQIVVSLDQFGPVGNGKAALHGSWSLLEGDRGRSVLRRDVALEVSSSARSGDAEAAAMSELLGQLATRIAATLTETKLL